MAGRLFSAGCSGLVAIVYLLGVAEPVQAQRQRPLIIDVPQQVPADQRGPIVSTTRRAKTIEVRPEQFEPRPGPAAAPSPTFTSPTPPTFAPAPSSPVPVQPLQPRGNARDFAGLPPLTLPASVPRLEVPLLRGGNLLFVRAQINGGESGLYLVDTGASTTVIDIDVATRLRLPLVGEGVAQGVGGAQFAEAVGIEQLSLGARPAQAVLGKHVALTLDLARWRRAFGNDFHGLLGASLWAQTPFTLDYRARTLTFHQRRGYQPSAGAALHRLYLRNHIPAVLGILNDRFTSLVEMDTGHEYSLDMDAEFVARNAALFDRAQSLPGLVQGIGGSAERWTTTIDALSIFGQRLEKLPVTFGKPEAASGGSAKAGKSAAPAPALASPAKSLGILGGRELRHFRLTFDYLGEKLLVEARPDNPLVAATGGKADPNARDALGIPPLALAVRNRDVAAARALLGAGAEPAAELPDGSTPLALAVALLQPELVALLLQHGADANGRVRFGDWPLLHALAERGENELVVTLLAHKAEVNRRGKGGVTPLMLAALRGHEQVVGTLLAHQADVNAVDIVGQSPLHFAVQGGRREVVAGLLAAGANVAAKTNSGSTPLTLAREKELAEIVKLLEAAGAKD